MRNTPGFAALTPAPDAVVVWEVGEVAGDLLSVRVVAPADFADECPGVLADVESPRARLRGARRHRQRVDAEYLVGVPFEQRAQWPAGTADAQRVDLLQVEEALRVLGGDDAALQFPRGTGEPTRVRGPVWIKRGDDVGVAGTWRPLPGAPLITAKRGERPAFYLQLVLGPQILLEKSGVLRPAKLFKRVQHDLTDRRAWRGRPDSGAGGTPQFAAQQLVKFIVDRKQEIYA